ncbi:uncharacterized protein Dwil_GK11352 [Drosophila willistoni]|uniref:Cystatin domain-containing protein n=1 Tax=Drosophila willistoni TaxID=7260 RepID=B4NAL9_DROWI|nr:sarcocystatin-A [Drosophila willistoni]EDW80833.1 uncharacterized protein Dwil_GK11352 [Drosophila willistoni]
MFAMKVIFVLGLALLVAADNIPGGISKLEGDRLKEAEQTLNNSLSKLASGDGPSYKLGKIISATHQVVAGSKYVYEVELIDGESKTKQCNVQIWSRPWETNGTEVTFNCPSEPQVVKSHA